MVTYRDYLHDKPILEASSFIAEPCRIDWPGTNILSPMSILSYLPTCPCLESLCYHQFPGLSELGGDKMGLEYPG